MPGEGPRPSPNLASIRDPLSPRGHPHGMDDQGRYTLAERRNYQPDPCPDCGSVNVAVGWARCETLEDPVGANLAIPGLSSCRDCDNLRS